ncbi:SCFD2 protein, partial [Polypterus senegalus]
MLMAVPKRSLKAWILVFIQDTRKLRHSDSSLSLLRALIRASIDAAVVEKEPELLLNNAGSSPRAWIPDACELSMTHLLLHRTPSLVHGRWTLDLSSPFQGDITPPRDPAASVLWESMLNLKHKEGVMEVRRHLVETASKENLPIKMTLGRVTPEQLSSYILLFKNNFRALEDHCGILQLSLATVQTIKHPDFCKSDSFLAFERLLLQVLGDSGLHIVLRQMLPMIKTKKERRNEDLNGSDILVLLVYIYSLTNEILESSQLDEAEWEVKKALVNVIHDEISSCPLLQRITGTHFLYHSNRTPINMSIEVITIDQRTVTYRVFSMPGDGTYLFHSFCYILHGHIRLTLDIWRNIVSYVLNDWDRFKVWIDDGTGDNYTTQEHYKSEMLKLFTYASACELMAAAQLFGCRFQVYRNGQIFYTF